LKKKYIENHFSVLTNVNYMNNRIHMKNIRTSRHITTDRRVDIDQMIKKRILEKLCLVTS